MIKIGVVYGGISTEHEVSKKSAKSILNNLNKEKYEIYPIFIDKDGIWYEQFEKEDKLKRIENVINYLKKLDIVFPILHGIGGEDGSIQGMCELFKIKYVGCNILASSIGMNKVYSKMIFEKANINQTKSIYIKKYMDDKYIYIEDDLDETEINIDELINRVNKKMRFPVFIKPSNCGSSVGVNKVKNKDELEKYIKIANKYDSNILIEEAIVGREIECAVIGSSKNGVEVSSVGEIIADDEFYSYDAKYNNSNSKTIVPARITEEKKNEIQRLSKKAFLAIGGNGLSRVDFFIEKDTEKVYLNEINTIPGFTEISMFPMLFQNAGYKYSDILDKIIEN